MLTFIYNISNKNLLYVIFSYMKIIIKVGILSIGLIINFFNLEFIFKFIFLDKIQMPL